MSALTLLIALAFAAGLAAFLAIWFTLTLPTRAAAMRQREASRPSTSARSPEASNDAVRGDKAPRKSMPLDMTPKRPSRDAPRAPSLKGAVRVEPHEVGQQAERQHGRDGDPFDRFLDRGRSKEEF